VKRTTSAPTIHRGNDDPTLTGHAGLLLVRDLNLKLDLVGRLDAARERVRQFKRRRRGLSRGELLMSRAESMLAVAATWLTWTRCGRTRQDVRYERSPRCPRRRPPASCCRGSPGVSARRWWQS
jgi:hypothetical protein